MTVVVRSDTTGTDSNWVLYPSISKYHAADKHDTHPVTFN